MHFDQVKRRDFIMLLGGAAAAWPLAARAQRTRVPRIGALILRNPDSESFETEFREGLRELGYVEGQNILFEFRSAEDKANLLPDLAAELVRLKVDVIAAIFTPCALAAKQATREIPILAVTGDAIGSGLVSNLARPGGNVTGLSTMAAETAGKSIELFRDMMPSLRRVAVLANPVDPFTNSFLEQVQLAGRTAGIEIQPITMVRTSDETEAAFETIVRERADAVVVPAIFFSKRVAELAIKHRLPTGSVLRSFADSGGLMSYGAKLPALFRGSAVLVHKILQGAKPADLPVEQPTKFELVVNLTTAKAIGLTIPESFLLRADAVIE
jgi:ABC-type uncharacterized transport system substrate-binding protein